MNNIIQKVRDYLNATLNTDVTFELWKKERSMPFHLKNRYRMYIGHILNVPCLMILDTLNEEPPGVIAKHIAIINKKCDNTIIYVRKTVTAINRQRLIKQNIPFIIPNNQMYLPPAGIDLREYFKRETETAATITPAAQATLLYLLHNPGNAFLARDFVDHLGYSRMTVNKSCKELLNLGLVQTSGTPKKLVYRLCEQNEKDQILSILQNPVKKTHYVTTNRDIGYVAGLSALAESSMLAHPKNSVVAVTAEQFKELKKDKAVSIMPYADPQVVQIEVWSYDPGKLTDDKYVDNISLYLSLRNDTDERTQIELGKIKESMKW